MKLTKQILTKLVKEEKGKLNEFNKAHFLNLIKQELQSKKGQLAYAEDKIRYHMTPKWERKEWLAVAKDLKKDIKNLQIRVKKVSKMKEEKLKEEKTLWQLTEEYVNEGNWKMKGKYLAKDGGVTSIPGNYDRDAIVVGIKNDTFKIYMQNGKLYAAGNKYDKFFKNGNDLAKWLNKNKAKYYGIDRR